LRVSSRSSKISGIRAAEQKELRRRRQVEQLAYFDLIVEQFLRRVVQRTDVVLGTEAKPADGGKYCQGGERRISRPIAANVRPPHQATAHLSASGNALPSCSRASGGNHKATVSQPKINR
jgi:hypothetical protein